MQSVRPVRLLLIRGANKEIRDNKNQTPIELIKNFADNEMEPDLLRLLVSI